MAVKRYDEVIVMPVSSPRGSVLDAQSFGRIFWPRRSMLVLMMSALSLWSLPIAIGYGLTLLF
jgi:hypothetical protein